jgi:LuxR family transcriptional regulator, quorum-sensing system regulator SdiA
MYQKNHQFSIALKLIHKALVACSCKDIENMWITLNTKLGVGGLLPATGHQFNGKTVLEKQQCFGIPPGWLDHYMAQNYHTVDPILCYALWTKKPFHWQQVFQHYDSALLDNLPELKKASGYNGFAYGCRIGSGGRTIAITSICLKSKQSTIGQRKIIYHILPHLNAIMPRPGFMPAAKLSLQETSVIKWAGEGKSSWETAFILQISEQTVKYHLANIYRKLQVSSKTQAVIKAYKMGLLI